MTYSPLSRTLLYIPAKLYELGVRLRVALYETGYINPKRLRAPVISIGNLTVGGTGKTPLVAFLARYLRDEGHQVAILSRGYKRASHGRIEVSNAKSVLSTPIETGDEPYLLATACPGVRVVVDADRAAAGKWLEDHVSISAFILDDGFQHMKLARDLNIVLLDATDPISNSQMIPFGRLREPFTGLRRADVVIVTRADQPFDQALIKETIAKSCRVETPVFYAYHDLTNLRRLDREENLRPIAFSQRKVAAISGIARPEHFIADVNHFGMRLVLCRSFPDHHRYHKEELREVICNAERAGAEAIITTEKDAVNLPPAAVVSSSLPIYAAQIEFRCEDEAAFKGLVLRSITRRKN